MTHRFSARLHAWLFLSIAAVTGRLRTAPQGGQGTVEYVALILLVAGVLAVAVTAAGASGKSLQLGEIITKQLRNAITSVSSSK